jgi:heterotetrameric sarcosine oxidase gamma subunit
VEKPIVRLAPKRVPHFFASGRRGAPVAEPGVRLTLIADEDRFNIEARRGSAPELLAALKQAFGAAPIDGPQTIEAGGFVFVGIGPSRWHAISRGEGRAAHREALSQAARAYATVVDVSHGFAVFRLFGDCAAEALAKLAPIDLDPASFAPGACAVTQLHGMSVQLRRTADGAYECAAPRSLGGSLYRALIRAAEPFGLLVDPVAPRSSRL